MNINNFPSILNLENPNGKNIEILYLKNDGSSIDRDIAFSFDYVQNRNKNLTLSLLLDRYISLGTIKTCASLNQLVVEFQGEKYSPNGEAREFIKSKGLKHTSMSTGDMLCVDGVYYLLDFDGFINLNESLLN